MGGNIWMRLTIEGYIFVIPWGAWLSFVHELLYLLGFTLFIQRLGNSIYEQISILKVQNVNSIFFVS